MICQPCRTAADFESADSWSVTSGTRDLETDRRTELVFRRDLHSQCRGCECQHRIAVLEMVQ